MAAVVQFETVEEYLDYLMFKPRFDGSRKKLEAWLEEMELTPGRCFCDDYAECHGWRLYYPEELLLWPTDKH